MKKEKDSEREREREGEKFRGEKKLSLRKEPVSECGKSRKKKCLRNGLYGISKSGKQRLLKQKRKEGEKGKEARIRSISKRVRLGQRIELSTPEKDSFLKGRDGEEECETDMEE